MRYFDEMFSKWGFGDGDVEPDGILAYREVYVTAMNSLLAQTDSAIRLLPYDRPGLHNGCMLVSVHAAFYATLSADDGSAAAGRLPRPIRTTTMMPTTRRKMPRLNSTSTAM